MLLCGSMFSLLRLTLLLGVGTHAVATKPTFDTCASVASAHIVDLSTICLPQAEPPRNMVIYKRVAFTKDHDHEKIFSLLIDLIRHPQHASAMEEVVFDPASPLYWYQTPDSFREAQHHILGQNSDIEQEELLMGAIADLGLDDKQSAQWLESLRSADPRHSAALSAASESQTNGYQGLIRLRENFNHHAAALVLALCPNIKTVIFSDGQSGPLQDFLLQNNYGMLRRQYLQKLETVKLLHNDEGILGDDRFYVHLDFLRLLRLFHRLPSLRHVSVNGVDQNNDGGFLEDLPPAISGLKEIHIGHSAYGSALLGSILRVPRRLEQVTLTTGGRSTLDGGNNILLPMTIGKALHDHKATLQRLDIELDEYVTQGLEGAFEDLPEEEEDYDSEGEDEDEPFEPDAPWWRDEWWQKDLESSTIRNKTHISTWHVPSTREYRLTIGSLHDFEALTHLSIGIRFLLAGRRYWRPDQEDDRVHAPFRLVNALPKSLEHLTIRGYKRGDNPYYDGHVDAFLAQREQRYPHLVDIKGIEDMVPSAGHERYPDDPSPSHRPRENVDSIWVEADA